MKTIHALVVAVAATLLVSTAATAAEKADKKDPKVDLGKPVLPDFKLDTGAKPADSGTAGATTGTNAAASDPTKPKKKELDVSRMMFDSESIRTVVKFHMPDIQECYEKVLADTGAKLEGRVVVGIIIDVNGNVSDARVLIKKSTLKDDRVHDCVLGVKTWAFPKPGDNRDHPIEYPFDLKVSQ